MKLVKTNQDLIVGRKYLCRTKPIKVQNGSFTTPELSILHVGEDQGRRYVGPSKFWAYDQHDGILSYDGQQRIKKVAEETLNNSVEILDSDYEVNSQAIERWDMIGPIPEIQEGLLNNLFDYPFLLKAFENPISLHPNGDVALYIPEGIENCSDDGWYLISDKDSARELNAELAANEEIDNYISGGEIPMVQSAMNNKPQFQKDMLPVSMFIRYNPQEMIGKYVRLTENKYTQLGYFPKGTILLIAEFNDGFLLKEEKSEIVIIGVDDGFEFIEFGYKEEPKPITLNFRDISVIDQYVSMALGNIKSENSYLNNGFQVFGQSGMGMGPNGMGLPNVTKEEKIAFLEAYINRLKNA